MKVWILMGLGLCSLITIVLLWKRTPRESAVLPEPTEQSQHREVKQPTLRFANSDVARTVALRFSSKKYYVAAVRFTTERDTPTELGGKSNPKTRNWLTPEGTQAVRICGEFTLIELFQGKQPMLGHTDTLVLTPGGFRDSEYMRIRDILHCEHRVEPILVLAAGTDSSKPVTNAQFFGPMNAGDLDELKHLANVLEAEGYEDLPKETAIAFLTERTNSLMTWVGLARLEDLRCCGLEEYKAAIRVLPNNQTPRIVKDALRAAIFDNNFRAALPKALLSEEQGAEKLERIIDTLLESMSTNLFRGKNLSRVPMLARARELRSTLSDKPEYNRVVAKLDELLARKWAP